MDKPSDIELLYLYIYATNGSPLAAQVPALFETSVEYFEVIEQVGDDCLCQVTSEEDAGYIFSAAEELGMDPEAIEAAQARVAAAFSDDHECE